MVQEIVGGRYFVTHEQLGSPTVRGDYEVPGFGIVVLDDADVHYAAQNPGAAYYIRKSLALGSNHFVVISRRQTA